jgi:hypothetical protein
MPLIAQTIPKDTRGNNIGTSGPLSALYNIETFPNLQYPRDLGNMAHAIKFYIFLPDTGDSAYSNETIAGTVLNTSLNAVTGQRTTEIATDDNSIFSGSKIQMDSTITLYMPDTLNTNLSASYQEDSLTAYQKQGLTGLFGALGDRNKAGQKGIISKIAGGVAGAAAGIGNIEFQTKGYAINPQVQVLFQTVGLRNFQYDFLFTPHDQEEATQVQQIISAFRFHAAPEIGGVLGQAEGGGPQTNLFFIRPSTFQIEYLFNGNKNPYLNQIGECVLENVTVDYAPNGFVTFNDGSPVQTRLTLQFKEIEIVDKNKINAGY